MFGCLHYSIYLNEMYSYFNADNTKRQIHSNVECGHKGLIHFKQVDVIECTDEEKVIEFLIHTQEI